MVAEFDARGLQVCIHAQGDRAIEAVLDTYSTVLSEGQGTRCGTGSSMADRCSRRWRHGPQRAGSRWRPSPDVRPW